MTCHASFFCAEGHIPGAEIRVINLERLEVAIITHAGERVADPEILETVFDAMADDEHEVTAVFIGFFDPGTKRVSCLDALLHERKRSLLALRDCRVVEVLEI